MFYSISPYSSSFHQTFASRSPLVAVIFCCENAPDCQTGHGAGISQNNSAVFPRISDILGVGTPSQEDSLRRRRGAGKRVGFCTGFVGNSRSPKNRPFSRFPPTPLQPREREICLPKGAIGFKPLPLFQYCRKLPGDDPPASQHASCKKIILRWGHYSCFS